MIRPGFLCPRAWSLFRFSNANSFSLIIIPGLSYNPHLNETPDSTVYIYMLHTSCGSIYILYIYTHFRPKGGGGMLNMHGRLLPTWTPSQISRTWFLNSRPIFYYYFLFSFFINFLLNILIPLLEVGGGGGVLELIQDPGTQPGPLLRFLGLNFLKQILMSFFFLFF
jgi:hypothetical protein